MDVQTDKFRTGLANVYQKLFAGFRFKPVAMLEIGIFRGGSLCFWSEFFKNAQSRIVGIDLQVPECQFPENVTPLVCDQNDADQLRRIGAEHGPFDIIIDDGCHFTAETKNCFENLFQRALKSEGYYVIEDWAVGYWDGADERYNGMVELVTEIIQRVPELNIIWFTVSLKPGQAYAVFQKGRAPWQA